MNLLKVKMPRISLPLPYVDSSDPRAKKIGSNNKTNVLPAVFFCPVIFTARYERWYQVFIGGEFARVQKANKSFSRREKSKSIFLGIDLKCMKNMLLCFFLFSRCYRRICWSEGEESGLLSKRKELDLEVTTPMMTYKLHGRARVWFFPCFTNISSGQSIKSWSEEGTLYALILWPCVTMRAKIPLLEKRQQSKSRSKSLFGVDSPILHHSSSATSEKNVHMVYIIIIKNHPPPSQFYRSRAGFKEMLGLFRFYAC